MCSSWRMNNFIHTDVNIFSISKCVTTCEMKSLCLSAAVYSQVSLIKYVDRKNGRCECGKKARYTYTLRIHCRYVTIM